MIMVMGYLPQLEQTKLQGLDKWWYDIGVSRVQVFMLAKFFYFAARGPQIMAVSSAGVC